MFDSVKKIAKRDVDGNLIPNEYSKAYKVVINGVTSHVPHDPANSDYAEIMRQVEAGELVIQEADAPE
jgi:hypothetical protein